ncbi:Trp biosynthesis-associated membrane protein [Kocuria palustris]|uniref:Trp biosynthesis-associated membrane protein n=1 Tax=Kocuria palustris TaxID=71999 RepID=UPI00077B7E54|nr:Trp biosynthesis-associated membrane protein [Kocuria palustris]
MTALKRKPIVVLLCLVLGAALFGASAMSWVHASVATAVSQIDVDVRGSDAAPAVSALGLVAMAGAVALSIAGPRLRPVVSLMIAGAGLGSLIAVIGAIADPVGVSEGVVGEMTGVVGTGAEHELTVGPWLCAAASMLVILGGVWALISSRTWARPAASRFERGTAQRRAAGDDDRESERRDDIDSWDALTEGRDPTGS